MFTVVIAEQAHLDSIREYELFLQPFLENKGIAFCSWQKEGRTLDEAVPDLNDVVSRHDQWRLLVVCDEEGLYQKNPFDLARYEEPEQTPDMDDITYRSLRRQARIEAFQRAAEKPLVRLMTWMCKQPLVNDLSESAQELDPELGEYLAQARAKEALRAGIMGDLKLQITLPTQILCLAKRCYDREAKDIREAWTAMPDSHYSKFCEWNLYFDKQRFLVFDILPKNHRNHTFDYIRFLSTMLVLAANEVPMGALNPHGLYLLDCPHDETALCSIISNYDQKLAATEEKIQNQIVKVQGRVLPRLSDEDAQRIFLSRMNIPVSAVKDFDYSQLYVPGRNLGLATDCPEDEERNWQAGYAGSRKGFAKLMKLPRRILRRTTSELHRINKAELDQAHRLNEFQLEDVRNFVEEEELKMVSTQTGDFDDISRFTDAMEAENDKMTHAISRRLSRNWILSLGIAALLCYGVGFVPMLFHELPQEGQRHWLAVLLLAGIGILALAALVTLVVQRFILARAYSNFNGAMRGIVQSVEGDLKSYSRYLSHACNVMRGNSVLNFCENEETPGAVELRILKKHQMDVRCVRAELRENFAQFLGCADVNPEVSPYSYDFSRPADYVYAIPFIRGSGVRIDFLQKGNLVEVPVDFVKSVRIRREELYE